MPGFARWIITVTLGVAMVPAGAGEASPRSGPFDQEGYVESADGVRLYYRTIGAGGDTIVVVHGGPGLDSGYGAGHYPHVEPPAEFFRLLHDFLK